VTKKNWRLADGEARNRAHASFQIPPREDRDRLRTGDLAKLCFEQDEPPAGERMWVRIDQCLATIPRRYTGQLENHPFDILLEYGDAVEFEPRHVIEIVRREDQ
jgi:hypothetical protein